MLTIEDLVTVVYCVIDDLLKDVQTNLLRGAPWRKGGFAPAVSDSEVLTMVLVGEFLGIDKDKAIHRFFRQPSWRTFFPKLQRNRTTFVRQAANLWAVLEPMHALLATELGAFEDDTHIVDGLPMPLCKLVRAARAKLFRGLATFGYCATKEEYYYGFHGHVLISFHGVITSFTVTAANADEREAVWELVGSIKGWLLGDRGYISRFLKENLRMGGIDLWTALRKNMKEEPGRSFELDKLCSAVRRRIETVIGQLEGRFHIEKIRARDVWHFTARVRRKILSHTLGIWLAKQLGLDPLHHEAILE